MDDTAQLGAAPVVEDACEICGVRDSLTPVEIGSDDVRVRIPLCADDAARLLTRVDRWLVAAALSRGHDPQQSRRLRDGEVLGMIRTWALEHGYPVARRGSLPIAVMTAYREAHA